MFKNISNPTTLSETDLTLLVNEFSCYIDTPGCIVTDYKNQAKSSTQELSIVDEVQEYCNFFHTKFSTLPPFEILPENLKIQIHTPLSSFVVSPWGTIHLGLLLFILDKDFYPKWVEVLQPKEHEENDQYYSLNYWRPITLIDYIVLHLKKSSPSQDFEQITYDTIHFFQERIIHQIIKQQLFNPDLLINYLSFFSTYKLNHFVANLEKLDMPNYKENNFKPIYLLQRGLAEFHNVLKDAPKNYKCTTSQVLTHLKSFIDYSKKKNFTVLNKLIRNYSDFLESFILHNELDEINSEFLSILAQEDFFVLTNGKSSPLYLVLDKSQYFKYYAEEPSLDYLNLLKTLLQKKIYHPEDEVNFMSLSHRKQKALFMPSIYTILEKYLLLKTSNTQKERKTQLL